jgi:sirohydrochlorin ferrochelatase
VAPHRRRTRAERADRTVVRRGIELLARARPARIVVVPYFLFAGRLIERLGDQVEAFRARYPWLKTRLHRTSVRTSACFRSSTSGSGKPWTAIGLCPVIMVAM